jgi:Ca2+-dependent lipid-binding protein
MSAPSSGKSTKKRSKKDKGFIKLKIYFDTSAGHLVAEVRESRNLSKSGTPFVKMMLTYDPKQTRQRTMQVKDKTSDPVWNEGFRWPLPSDPRVG